MCAKHCVFCRCYSCSYAILLAIGFFFWRCLLITTFSTVVRSPVWTTFEVTDKNKLLTIKRVWLRRRTERRWEKAVRHKSEWSRQVSFCNETSGFSFVDRFQCSLSVIKRMHKSIRERKTTSSGIRMDEICSVLFDSSFCIQVSQSNQIPDYFSLSLTVHVDE